MKNLLNVARTMENETMNDLAIEASEAERAEREAIEAEEQARWEYDQQTLRDAEEVGRKTGDWSYYSDVYKDIYGIRPRW